MGVIKIINYLLILDCIWFKKSTRISLQLFIRVHSFLLAKHVLNIYEKFILLKLFHIV